MFSKSKNTDVANNRNQRRVIRNDITVSFQAKVGRKIFPYFVELLNISPQSMAFRCNKSLEFRSLSIWHLVSVTAESFFMKGDMVHRILETESGKPEIQKAFSVKIPNRSIIPKIQ